jgi:hypothetical protein
LLGAWSLAALWPTASAAPPTSPEAQAISYLSREVPRWTKEHKCFSCHNNGDAARALIAAGRQKQTLASEMLQDTSRFLAKPDDWDKNGPDGPFKDKRLARLHFAMALVDAHEEKLVKEHEPVKRAAEMIAEIQDAKGSWNIDGGEELGSSITYGRFLRTHFGRQVLLRTDARKHKDAIARAEKWLTETKAESVVDAAAVLLAFPADVPMAEGINRQRERALRIIAKGQAKEGGWGPYVTSPPEVFDTALVLLALAGQRDLAEYKPRLAKGREFLIAQQKDDGSWEETTRPSGAESYAQRVSTTAWALRALLATRALA